MTAPTGKPGNAARSEVSLPEFWDKPLDEILTELHATREGLTQAEAEDRLTRFGGNALTSPSRWALLTETLSFVSNPLVLVLLAASAVSALVGEQVDAGIIAAMVLLSMLLDFIQAYRSGAAAARLRKATASSVMVRRDGKEQRIPVAAVVPGDVLMLASGSLVAADARLIAANDMTVNEAALTGESLPVEKNTQDLPPGNHALSEADNAVFSGTAVVTGTGQALVVRTGAKTEFGQITRRLSLRPPETEFEHGTRRFGALILYTVFALVLVVFLTSAIRHRDPLQSFLFAVALAVGITPEFLPMIISVALSQGAVRMARKRVLVRRLTAIENFGSMNVLCSDKTGTLTEGKVAFQKALDADGNDAARPLELARINSHYTAGIKNPLDRAVLVTGDTVSGEYRLEDEIAFDFERRRQSVVLRHGDEPLLMITKGAPESILTICDTRERDGKQEPLDAAARSHLEEEARQLASEGFRVLGVCFRTLPPQPQYGADDERGMVFSGFLTFLDPPRTDARDVLAALARDGIQVKILTGDNDLVTRQVCQQVGLPVEGVILGNDLARVSDAALPVLAERTTIFARVSPEQKNRVLMALKHRGHVVGYLGDGINDAPSLRTADVGISVDSAVDVARDAADLILVEKSLDVLHEGVLEGRRSFGNIMKYLLMATSSNFGNMLSMAFASLFLPFLPLLPPQILVNNFLYDLSQVTIPGDRVDASYTRTPRRWDIHALRRFMLLMGPVSSLFDFMTFAILLLGFHASVALFRTSWFFESLATQTLVVFVIRTAGNPFRSRPSWPLTITVLLIVFVGALFSLTRAGAWIGFVPLPLPLLGVILGVMFLYLATAQGVKYWLVSRRLL